MGVEGDGPAPALLDGSIGGEIDEYLFYLVTQVQNRRIRDFAPSLDTLGLSIAHWRALSTINRLEGCLMSELAEFTTIDRTTLTRTVDQLVEMGLVERCTTPDDRRTVRVVLTPHGESVFRTSLDRLRDHNGRILTGFSAEEMRTLRALLQRLLCNIVRDETLYRQVCSYSR